MLFIIVLYIILIYLACDGNFWEDYDYDRENPNALISGKNIAGTVYALEPDNAPGLGWIL